MTKERDKHAEEPEPEAPPEAPVEEAEETEAALAERDRKIEGLENRYRRAVADLANAHKRFQKERERIGQRAVAHFVETLLPMLDNMAHSLRAAEESHDAAALIEGFRLIESQTLQTLGDAGVEAIESVGKPFDPEIHHAVTTDVTEDVPPGMVTEELGRGFLMGDFVVRPAQVKVAAAPAEGAAEGGPQAEEEKEGANDADV